MDFQSPLTAVFGDYHSGEGLTQWYLTWGSKGRRVIQTFSFFSPLIVAECTISDRMEAFVQFAVTTATKMTSHYLKDIWSSLLKAWQLVRPGTSFSLKKTDGQLQLLNLSFWCEEEHFGGWIDSFVQVSCSSRSTDRNAVEIVQWICTAIEYKTWQDCPGPVETPLASPANICIQVSTHHTWNLLTGTENKCITWMKWPRHQCRKNNAVFH